MDASSEENSGTNKTEIRFFGKLRQLADAQGWSFPFYFELNQACSALELAEQLGIPTEDIEGVFVNGLGKPLDKGWIRPGDRVGFIPYGIPGPYRVFLGFFKKWEQK